MNRREVLAIVALLAAILLLGLIWPAPHAAGDAPVTPTTIPASAFVRVFPAPSTGNWKASPSAAALPVHPVPRLASETEPIFPAGVPAPAGKAPTPPAKAPRTAASPKPVSAATLAGIASWYCSATSRCTIGHPGGMYAAIRRDLLALVGQRVTVCTGSRCVVVEIIDCNCAPGANLIDLYSEPFARLAPLSAGRIAVTVAP